MFILHQSYHGDYVCILGRVAMSDSDGMGSALEHLLPGTRELQWPRPIAPGNK
jgi:hypothetical protein